MSSKEDIGSRNRIPESAHFYVSDNDMDLELLQGENSSAFPNHKSMSFARFLKVSLLSFEFNLDRWMNESDPELMKIVNQMLMMAPGYKSSQIIFTYYLLTKNLLVALFMALLYPLPHVLLFTYFGFYLEDLHAESHWNYSIFLLIILTGVRSSVVALLSKYSLHMPEGKFYWVVLIATIIISLMFPNNYVFMILYIITAFLSFYVKEDGRGSRMNSIVSEESLIIANYKEVTPLRNTFPSACGFTIIGMAVGVWLYSKYNQESAYVYTVYEQFIFIALLNHSKVAMIFYPLLFTQVYPDVTLVKAADVIGLNFILPGSHFKAFFTLIGHDLSVLTFTISYLCLYLPSILICCVYLGHRKWFYSLFWDNTLRAMQGVGNGLVLSMICWILVKETCNFNAVAYSAVVIFCVIKLYHLRQLFAALLGIFLIFSRSGVLYLNKNISFEDFACISQIA